MERGGTSGEQLNGGSGRRRSWAMAIVVAVAAAWGSIAPAAPERADARVGTDLSVAERVGWYSLEPPSYPSSDVCDAVTGGLAGGFGSQRPNDVATIGSSRGGRPILAEHYGPRDGPQLAVVGTIHGNECAPGLWTSAVREIDWSNVGVWVIPALNPDGYASFTRRNLANVDLNADGTRRSEPETQALLSFTKDVRPVVTFHIHSPNGFIGSHGSMLAVRLANLAGATAGVRVSLAGFRPPGRWFLWQAQHDVVPGSGAVLFEIAPVVTGEAPSATRRLPVSDVATERQRALSVWAAINDQFRT